MEAIHEAYGSAEAHNSFVMCGLYGDQLPHRDFQIFQTETPTFHFDFCFHTKISKFLFHPLWK